uniref:ATP synthase complex subunit 8 n=1 Tax=Acidiella diversa TaxID=2804768 RepID=A0A7U0KN68_9MUSC|nr:ATP synthase F0 subunit 8 [Acidiella diversa]QQW48066.1 ATP synthase F0 subunit 8 [Acidiella diversa]
MPQMAPIGWLSLFIIFSITFILFSMMNYYSMIPKSPKSKISNKLMIKSLNWKW